MAEPVSLEEAKAHLRVDGNAEDGPIGLAIETAREWVEGYTGLSLVPITMTEQFDGFAAMTLRGWPLAGDPGATVQYLDQSGDMQDFTQFRIVSGKRPAQLLPAPGAAWPLAYPGPGTVMVSYDAGIADPADVPAILRLAILDLVAALYWNREAGISADAEVSARRACRRYKRWVL